MSRHRRVDRVVGMSLPAASDPLPPVVAFKELMQLLGVGRTWTNQLLREPGFPQPIAVLGVGKIWSTADVIAHCERVGRHVHTIGRISE